MVIETVQPVEKYVKRYTVELNPKIHANMRELARRKRVQIGVLYEEALQAFLERPDNYLGAKRSAKKMR